MKKVKFEKKLSLNKETISKLNKDQMNNVKGGQMILSLVTCRSAVSKCAGCGNTCHTGTWCN